MSLFRRGHRGRPGVGPRRCRPGRGPGDPPADRRPRHAGGGVGVRRPRPRRGPADDADLPAARDVRGRGHRRRPLGRARGRRRGRVRRPRRAGPPRPVAPAARRPHRRPDAGTRIYAVASGKGGVGKSSVTANLAVALADQGLAVGLLDADVWGYSVPHLFGTRRAPVALSGIMFPVEAHGVRLMAPASSCPRTSRWSGAGRCCTRRSSSSSPTSTGATSTSCCSTSRPAPATSRSRCWSCVPSAALLAVTTPQPAARRSPAGSAGWPRTRGCRSPASSRTCRRRVRGLRPRDGAVWLRRRAAARRRVRRAAARAGAARRGAADRRGRRRAGGPPRTRTAPSAQELTRLAADLPTVRRTLSRRRCPSRW